MSDKIVNLSVSRRTLMKGGALAAAAAASPCLPNLAFAEQIKKLEQEGWTKRPVACTMCGAPCTPSVNPAMQKSKLVAGLLGIFVGGLGIHNFYLGNNSRAVLQIVLSFVTCGAASLWGFIEGIMILCGNINTDANGVPLGE